MSSKLKKKVYLDHAATTPVDKVVLRTMQPFFTQEFGNPTSLYTAGTKSRNAVEKARKKIAEILHAQPDTIVFTGSGTESDNLAILGTLEAALLKGHIITTAIEHHAVLSPIKKLENYGWSVTYLPVNKDGKVNPSDVMKAIRPDTQLISIMYANNEIGTIEPVAEIGRQLIRYRKEKGSVYPYFHTDACQAAGYLPLDVEKLHVDLMTINGSKVYGPKGVGVLYVRRGIKLAPQIVGGGQESGLRSGTENVPVIVGLSTALELVNKLKEKESKRLRTLSLQFKKALQKLVPAAIFNGAEIGEDRLPNNLNFTLPGIDGEALLIYLDAQGVACSVGSACAAEEGGPSHVLSAIGVEQGNVQSSVRFSLGKTTTKDDIAYTINVLKKVLPLLQQQ